MPNIIALQVSDDTLARQNPIIRQEQQTALDDLLHANSFAPRSGLAGPFAVRLDVVDNRVVFHITCTTSTTTETITLSVTPLRGLIKDYFLMCDSYYKALHQRTPAQLEAIDMGRRGIHNEAAEKLLEILGDKLTLDFDTARRLFTLICVLHSHRLQGVV